jgi:hypothetical protein
MYRVERPLASPDLLLLALSLLHLFWGEVNPCFIVRQVLPSQSALHFSLLKGHWSILALRQSQICLVSLEDELGLQSQEHQAEAHRMQTVVFPCP